MNNKFYTHVGCRSWVRFSLRSFGGFPPVINPYLTQPHMWESSLEIPKGLGLPAMRNSNLGLPCDRASGSLLFRLPFQKDVHMNMDWSSSDYDDSSSPLRGFNENTDDSSSPLRGLTENNSATFLSSGNPCLDFFFHVVPDTPPEQVIRRLELAWNHNPLTTLKLVCNLRAIRGTGKADRESFYTSALWIHKHHPKTLASNIPLLVKFGYFKDLLEILYRLIQGPDVRQIARSFLENKRNNKKKRNSEEEEEKKARLRATVPREQRIEANRVQMKAVHDRAKELRKEKESAMAEKATERYNSDPDYKRFRDQVSSFFADCLTSDIQTLNSGNSTNISLAAKWCPSVDSSYDKATLICESIASIIYPRNSDPEFDDANYAFKIKDRLRKQILVPLRSALQLPEVYMSAQQWSSLPYKRVASIAMKNYTDIFLARDELRFREYLQNVATGKAKIAAGALLPHEIIKSLNQGGGEVAELQWKQMVDDLSKKGKLTNCIAVCDVSGSMEGRPMEVSVALGLLVSELTSEPWKGHVITFSELPELHLIKGGDLESKTTFIWNMDFGYNTNFQRVFDRMLEVAVERKLGEEEMVKRVFVFSDMEFDEANGGDPWETDYEAIQRKYKLHGYEVPEIVFWNLRNSKSTPVTAARKGVARKGVALLSGFSKNLLKLFLEEGGACVITPEDTMEAAISGYLYQKLVVCD